jgi:hypothetical protein
MLERLFVIQMDNRFLLKVEDFAEPMSVVIKNRALNQSIVAGDAGFGIRSKASQQD